jgi:hypothetical protein
MKVNCSSIGVCPPRMYLDLSSGTPQCVGCPAGTFNDITTTLQSCTPCPSGKFSIGGAQLCEDCPIGTYYNSSGASSCLSCPRGTYADTQLSYLCNVCPGNTSTASTGSTSVNQCYQGYCSPGYSNFVNGSCSPCLKGTALNSSNVCALCTKGKFSSTDAATQCTDCPFNSFSNASGKTTCTICPSKTGVDCPPASSVPIVSAGLYRNLDADPANIAECYPAEACLAAGNSSTQCAEGYEGVLCSSCQIEWFRMGLKCVKCMSKLVRRVVLAGAALILLTGLTKLLKSQKVVPPSVKVCLMWFQFIFLYPSLSGKWPASLSWIFSIGNVFNFDIGYLGASCEIRDYSYYNVTLLKVLLPLLAFAGILLINLAMSRFSQNSRSEVLRNSTAEFIFLICYFSVQLCSSLLSIFNCTVSTLDGQYRLNSDPSTLCYGSQWKTHFVIHVVLLVLYFLVIPLAVLLHLFIVKRSDPAFDLSKSVVGLAIKQYRKGTEWFELLRQYQRFAFILVRDGVRLSREGKIAFYAILIMVYQYIEGKARPYNRQRQNDISQL